MSPLHTCRPLQTWLSGTLVVLQCDPDYDRLISIPHRALFNKRMDAHAALGCPLMTGESFVSDYGLSRLCQSRYRSRCASAPSSPLL